MIAAFGWKSFWAALKMIGQLLITYAPILIQVAQMIIDRKKAAIAEKKQYLVDVDEFIKLMNKATDTMLCEASEDTAATHDVEDVMDNDDF